MNRRRLLPPGKAEAGEEGSGAHARPFYGNRALRSLARTPRRKSRSGRWRARLPRPTGRSARKLPPPRECSPGAMPGRPRHKTASRAAVAGSAPWPRGREIRETCHGDGAWPTKSETPGKSRSAAGMKLLLVWLFLPERPPPRQATREFYIPPPRLAERRKVFTLTGFALANHRAAEYLRGVLKISMS